MSDEYDFEYMEGMIDILSKLDAREREELAAQTDRIDLGEYFDLDSEFNIGDTSGAQIDRIGPDRFLVFQPNVRISIIDLDQGTSEEIEPESLLPGDEITALKVSNDGQFAAVGKDKEKVTKGHLQDRYYKRQQNQVIDIAERYSFGFLPNGKFMHLAKNGIVMIDGEPSAHSITEERKWLPDKKTRYDRIRIEGGLVNLQTIVRDEAFRDSMETMIVVNGKYKWDKSGWNDHRYVISNKVVHADRDDFSPLFEGKEAGLKPNEAYSRDGRGTLMPTSSLQPDGFVIDVEDTGYEGGDEFYHHPKYNVVGIRHINPETGEVELLASQKVDRKDLLTPVFAVSLDGELGFVGKSNGAVEILDLAKGLRSDYEPPTVTADAWVTEETIASKGLSAFLSPKSTSQTAHLSFERHGDMYGHRKPPKQVCEFRAFDSTGIRAMFTTENGKLHTLGDDGRLRTWKSAIPTAQG